MLSGTTETARRKSVRARLAMTQLDSVRKCRNPTTDTSTRIFPKRIQNGRTDNPRKIQFLTTCLAATWKQLPVELQFASITMSESVVDKFKLISLSSEKIRKL